MKAPHAQRHQPRSHPSPRRQPPTKTQVLPIRGDGPPEPTLPATGTTDEATKEDTAKADKEQETGEVEDDKEEAVTENKGDKVDDDSPWRGSDGASDDSPSEPSDRRKGGSTATDEREQWLRQHGTNK